jgi:chaperonin GroEL
LADAMSRVGRDGIITVEDAKGTVTSLEVVEGMQFERGYLSPYFVNNSDRMHALHDDAYVLLTDGKLTGLQELVGILELVLREKKPILIIADEIEGAALQTLIVNKVRSGLNVVAIKAPGYGAARDAFLSDIAVLTGGRIASPTTGLVIEKMVRSDLGRCKRFVVDAKSTTIVGTGTTAAAVAIHVDSLREQLKDPTLAQNELLRLRERIARLASGVAVVKVGGATELEMIERKHRIEDALHATRAAVEEGILPGGGTALAHAAWIVDRERNVQGSMSELTPSELAGYSIVMRACEAPLRRIVSNGGGTPDVVIQTLRSALGEGNAGSAAFSHGYDAATETYSDLVSAGILDPLKVTRTALVNAASVACTFTTLNSAIAPAQAQ